MREVVCKNLELYSPIIKAIGRLLGGNDRKSDTSPILVSIDGMSGSGKSSLAELLAGIYSCNVFHMDDFFLQPFQRTPQRFAEAGGNVDYERFQEEVLEHIGDAPGLSYRAYDCHQQKLRSAVFVPAKRLNIIEGSYSQHPYFKNPYDLNIFLELSEAEQKRRIRERNGEFMLERFLKEWIPLENAYFAAFKIRENASLVLTNGGQML